MVRKYSLKRMSRKKRYTRKQRGGECSAINPYRDPASCNVLSLNKEECKSFTSIKKAYMKFAKIYHPDKGGDPEEFKKIASAYEILTNCQDSNSSNSNTTGSFNPNTNLLNPQKVQKEMNKIERQRRIDIQLSELQRANFPNLNSYFKERDAIIKGERLSQNSKPQPQPQKQPQPQTQTQKQPQPGNLTGVVQTMANRRARDALLQSMNLQRKQRQHKWVHSNGPPVESFDEYEKIRAQVKKNGGPLPSWFQPNAY
jgi:hypothetical protein